MVRVIEDPINSFQLENVNYNFSLLFSYVRALSGGQDIAALVQSVEQALQTAQSLNVQGQELVDELTPLLSQLNSELEKVGELKFSGQWDSSSSYKTLNIVGYNGSSFIAKRDNSNVTPVEGDDWGLISQRGAQGIQGVQGEPGRGLIILGLLPNAEALPSTAQPGDAYVVENTPNNELYVYINGSFVNVGPFGSGSGMMIEKATSAEAKAGTNDDKYITPLALNGVSGTLSDLDTTNKDTLVDAINEVKILANDNKTRWAGVVGEPLLNTDTAAQLEDKTQTLKNTFASNLSAKGQSSLGTEDLIDLISKIPNIQSGTRVASGFVNRDPATSNFTLYRNSNIATLNSITVTTNFLPRLIVIFNIGNNIDGVTTFFSLALSGTSNFVTSSTPRDTTSTASYLIRINSGAAYVNSTGFRLPIQGSFTSCYWFAVE